MEDFEELEGMNNQDPDPSQNAVSEEKEEDDTSFRPVNCNTLQSQDIYYEMEKRQLKSTGFPDTDRVILQAAFDEEFKNDLENARLRRLEGRRRAALQAGLQKRRMLMEKTLQEEQDELAANHQVGMMIEFVKENMVNPSIRLDVNSISARSLTKAMWANSTITCLDLSSNELNDHAGSYLARILKRNSTIKKIELDNNKLGPKTCQAFGESLKLNSSLVYLSLDSNPIAGLSEDSSGIKAIAEALRVNKTLTSINLWRTGIPAAAGLALANAVDENSTLLFCDVGHNSIELCDVKRIADKLDVNLAAYEADERVRRQNALSDEDRQRRIKDEEEVCLDENSAVISHFFLFRSIKVPFLFSARPPPPTPHPSH